MIAGLFLCLSLLPVSGLQAAPVLPQTIAVAEIAPPANVKAVDRPDDNGGVIIVTWDPSPQDHGLPGPVKGYAVLRSRHRQGLYEALGETDVGTTRYVDANAELGIPFFYQVAALAGEERPASAPVGPVFSTYQWFNRGRLNLLLAGLLIAGLMIYHIFAAQRRGPPEIRKLPGIEAIDEAIDRAADSGRPVLFVTGSEDLNDIGTLAGLSVLEPVAERVAGQDVGLLVPQLHSLVMAATDDILARAYETAGKPAGPGQDANFYVSDEQFGFVAGVNGVMCRQTPAACFYFGSFYAESLALAEMGQTIGATQIAGTGESSQIPFLLAACDHVLIGEEMFAAAAYLSREPRQLGCLKGQDLAKLLAAAAIGVGCLIATLAALTGTESMARLRDAFGAVFRTG